jgi:ABC-type polysaccharide/polyol phosphate export permease
MTVLMLGYLFSILFQRDFETYLLYLASGFATWLLISSSLTEGVNVFVKNRGFIRELPMPLPVYVWALWWKLLIAYGMYVLLAMAISFLVQGPQLVLLLIIPGAAMIMVTSFFSILLLGAVGARYRDLIHLLPNVLRALFFITPVLWSLDRRERLVWLLDYNPIYYFIELVRAPLQGAVPVLKVYLVSGGVMIAVTLLALSIFSQMRNKLVYWV